MDKIRIVGREMFEALSIRNYRLYFIGQIISLSGTWMQVVAQSWLVLQLTHSGTAIGIVMALQFLPILFFAPWAGVIVDRYKKQHILYITQSLAGLLALILWLAVATNHTSVILVYVLALALGFVSAFDNPARQTFIIEMVGNEELQDAIALNSTEVNIARVIGPALAGICIARVGLGACFLLNGISYVAVIIGLFFMDTKMLHTLEPNKKGRGQLKEGFLYIFHNDILKNTLFIIAIIGTFSYEFSVSLPLIAQFVFHQGASGFAALTTAMGIGAVLGAIIPTLLRKDIVKVFVLSAFLFGISIILSAISMSFLLTLVLLVFVGMFSILFLTLGNTILQTESNPHMRGRVMAFWAVAFLGSTPIGAPIIGWIGQNLGARWSLLAGGFAALAASIIGIITLADRNLVFKHPHMEQPDSSILASEKNIAKT